MAKNFQKPPAFGEDKPYSRYVEELRGWTYITDVEKKKQGMAIALSLPEDDKNQIRDKVFNEIDMDLLKDEDGVETIIKFLDDVFKKDELSEVYEHYVNFDRYKRDSKETMDRYILEFEKLYNKTKKFKMDLPQSVLAFKLLENSGLKHNDRLLVLTGVNYAEQTTLFQQMKSALKKFFGQQSKPISSEFSQQSSIKLELSEEDVNVAYTPKYGYQQRGFFSNRGKRGNGYRNQRQRGQPKNFTRRSNPVDQSGNHLRCMVCQSTMHFVRDCPHAYENNEQMTFLTTQEFALYTGQSNTEMSVLMLEAANSAVLDSACSSTVSGKDWLNCYLDSLTEDEKCEVVHKPSTTVFKFGGGERLQSLGKVVVPCYLAGKKCSIETDVILSDIPMLLSKQAMKKANMKLDLANDKAEIYGTTVALQNTSAGHYCIPLKETALSIKSCFAVTESQEDMKKVVTKLHKQFAHPSSNRLKCLLKDAGVLTKDRSKMIDELSANCTICAKFKKTPARPVVSLPLATNFNECVVMDLKEWVKGTWILHLVDAATRFTLSTIIHNKKPSTIVEKVLLLWVGSGFGCPKKFLADNGGEFANSEYKDMCENLNIDVRNTAARSAWQNGLCERNHAVVDECVQKIIEDNPDMKLEIALIWAVHAKNCLQMNSGYSSYQLIFGQNPNLPSVITDKPPALEGSTISERFYQHLNGLHSARRAFIRAESSERIRRALRHQIRTSDQLYETGDVVFYKRDTSNKWKGPGTVIGQDGKTIFVRHGSSYVRVPTCRLLKVGDEFNNANKQSSNTTNSTGHQDAPKNNTINDETDTEDDEDWNAGSHSSSTANLIVNDNVTSPGDDVGSDNLDMSIELPSPTVQPANGNNDSFETDQTKQKVESTPIVSEQDVTPCNDGNLTLPTSKVLPKVNQRIMIRNKKTDDWIKANVISRGGKAKGKYNSWFNVKNLESGNTSCINFDEVNWKEVEDSVHFVEFEEQLLALAKQRELDTWKSFKVYDEVKNSGQHLISTRWVVTEKEDDQQQKTIKARLVVRGFEDKSDVPTDSPTAAKDTLRIFFGLTSTLHWSCETIDIKSAFLQGDGIVRDVFIKPPKEARALENTIWKLRKVVYGLNDASRNWYLTVREKLLSLGCIQSSIDKALFTWKDPSGDLAGMFIMHVDDFLYAGSHSFQQVIEKLSNIFKVGSKGADVFRYIGLDVKETDAGTTVSQDFYISTLVEIHITSSRKMRKHDALTKDEEKQLRAVIGQLNWIATQSRPDLSFQVLELSTVNKFAKVEHLIQANKLIKKLKSEPCKIFFPRLGNLKNLEILLYNDASYANLPDGTSSTGGRIVWLRGENGNCCPISWSSTKIKRVVRSTLAAEALSLAEGCESAFLVGSLLTELIHGKQDHRNLIPISAFVDNKSLVQNVYSTTMVSEKRLRIDVAIIQEMVRDSELTIRWIEASFQLADSLTKKGASTIKLRDIFNTGRIQTPK